MAKALDEGMAGRAGNSALGRGAVAGGVEFGEDEGAAPDGEAIEIVVEDLGAGATAMVADGARSNNGATIFTRESGVNMAKVKAAAINIRRISSRPLPYHLTVTPGRFCGASLSGVSPEDRRASDSHDTEARLSDRLAGGSLWLVT